MFLYSYQSITLLPGVTFVPITTIFPLNMWKALKRYLMNPDLERNTQGQIKAYIPDRVKLFHRLSIIMVYPKQGFN